MNIRLALFVLGCVCALALAGMAAHADETCSSVSGDAVLSARTPQVDLFDGPSGRRVQTIDQDKFPTCLAVMQRAPNMMLEINVNGVPYWVPPHMVNYRLTGKKPAICRNLAMGSDTAKVGATRALGEDCPTAKPTP